MMDQADVTTSEKYRRIMEAYQGELEYGRTTEAYSESLPTTGQTVEFLRIGRTLLVYQTSDQEITGWFNPTTRVTKSCRRSTGWKSRKACPLRVMRRRQTWSCCPSRARRWRNEES